MSIKISLESFFNSKLQHGWLILYPLPSPSRPLQYCFVHVIFCMLSNKAFLTLYDLLFSAKNEAMQAVSIQEVTGLADSYDSPLICTDLEVSIPAEVI